MKEHMEASGGDLKRIHSIKERENHKMDDEKATWLISSRKNDFMKTWTCLAIWAEKIFDVLKKGIAFRVEINFDPESDIAEIDIYEKVTVMNEAGMNQECPKEQDDH